MVWYEFFAHFVDAAQLLVFVSFRRQIFLFEITVDAASAHGINNCEGRHPDYHTRHPHKSAEQGYGKNNPEAGKPSGIAQDFWAEYIAVKLLQNENK